MNEQNLLLIKAAIYCAVRYLANGSNKDNLNKLRKQLNDCSKIGISFKYLNNWDMTEQDIEKFKELEPIILASVMKKERNSSDYQKFFAEANEYFQELKPYADAFCDVKIKNIEPKKLGFYIDSNNKKTAKPAAASKNGKFKHQSILEQKLGAITKKADIKFNDFTDFSKNATELNIYIDEAWPCEDYHSNVPKNPDDKKTGVIAGIVWIGHKIDPEILPQIPTHLRDILEEEEKIIPERTEKIPIPERIKKMEEILLPPLQNLLDCKNAMPFIFPLKNEANIDWKNDYFAIWKAAIKILLGWVLPQNGKECNVRIYSEHIRGFGDGTDLTDHIRGLLEQAGDMTGRFSRFNIEKVEWQAKDFGYIPYGDLLGYMTLPVDRSVVFKKMTRGEELAGYLPVSLNLFDVLLRLDIIEETKNVEDIFGLIDEIYGTKIYRFIMKDLKQRLNENKELKQKLLYSLEARYLDKDRDMGKLRKYFTEIMPLIESEEEDAKTVTKLLFTSIRLQDANHEGNPEKIRAHLEDYDEKRKRALELGEFESVADCELNIAVHYNDEFLFDKAFETISRNKSYFNSFRLPTRCKFYSSLGQSMSINKQFDKADQCFCQAVDSFEKSEEQNKLKEIDQTTVYRMFNLLEWKNPEYPQKFKEFFGKPADAAVKFAKENSTADQYRHHLFIRSVFECSELAEYKQAYLAESKNWEFWPQHPWQLIEFYRAMLSDDEAESYKHLENALKICGFEEHGGIIALIGAVLAAAAIAKYPSRKDELKRKSLEFIEKAGSVAGAGKILGDLRQRLEKGCDFASVLEFLPFNYR